jgi:hypothetical protein
MLRSVALNVHCFQYMWSISPLTGGLRRCRASAPSRSVTAPPEPVARALEYCTDPFRVEPSPHELRAVDCSALKSSALSVASTSKVLSHQSFFMLRLWAVRRRVIFDNSEAAFFFLNHQTDLKFDQDCLCRSFFVAKTSKSFASSGVLFIGAFLPTFQMHAWIIDQGGQPDQTDRYWINYTPLLAFYVAKKY